MPERLKITVEDPVLYRLIAESWSDHEQVEFIQQGESDVSITPPVRLGAVMDRIEAELNARQNGSGTIALKDGIVLDRGAKTLTIEDTDTTITLTDTESLILSHLADADGPVSRQTLMTGSLGYHETAETHTVETHIYRLRQKLESHPPTATLIQTDKDGYRLQQEPSG